MTNTHPFLPLRYAYTVDICVDLLDLLDEPSASREYSSKLLAKLQIKNKPINFTVNYQLH